jgi:endonuclease/exonuclease/phosphatase family metal-dependent hydrolase
MRATSTNVDQYSFALIALPLIGVAAWSAGVAPTSLKVMTFNLRYSAARDGADGWNHRKDSLLERVRAADPDLLGTQEGLVDQIDFLRDNLKGYQMVGVGRDDGGKNGEFVALFVKTSRMVINDSGTYWLSETPEKPGSKSWDSALPRIVTWAKLTVRGQSEFTFVCMNTHWDHVGRKGRLESAKLMRQWARDHARKLPVIVTGDLNVDEDAEPFKQLLHGKGMDHAWIDGYRVLYPERLLDEATYHGFKGTRRGSRIDFILHTPHFQTIKAAIDRTARDGRYPSDHYPVSATVEIHGVP